MGRDEYVSFQKARGMRETPRALLVRFRSGAEAWIPKSQIHDDSEVFDASEDLGTLIVSQWFADKEGLDDEEPRTVTPQTRREGTTPPPWAARRRP